MKLILKNIWTNRRKNGWIFAELLIVTLVAWYFTSIRAIRFYDDAMFDIVNDFGKDQLIIGQIKYDITVNTPSGKLPEQSDQDYIRSKHRLMRDMIRQLPEVETACITLHTIGYSTTNIQRENTLVSAPNDTTRLITCRALGIEPCNDYFATQGIKLIAGGNNVDSLFDNMPENGVVITERIAKMLWGRTNVIGEKIHEQYQVPDYSRITYTYDDAIVCGICKDIIPYRGERYPYTMFYKSNIGYNWPTMLIRLKPGVNAEEFINQTDWSSFKIWRYGITPYTWQQEEDRHKYNNIIVQILDEWTDTTLTFFALNVFIGAIGTFWIQIRRRREDIGIMRSFGATRFQIVRGLIAEGTTLTLMATFVASLIIVQFLDIRGSSVSTSTSIQLISTFENDWTTQFWPHFTLVTAIVFIMTATIVSIAIALPAIYMTRKAPIESLRERQ